MRVLTLIVDKFLDLIEWILSPLVRLHVQNERSHYDDFMTAFAPRNQAQVDPSLTWSADTIPAKPVRMKWEVTPDGKLLLNGENHPSQGVWTKEILENAVLEMRQAAANAHKVISVTALLIDPFVATALWNAKIITQDDLEAAVHLYDGLTIVMKFGEVNTWVAIVGQTYYENFEFYIDGLPNIHRVENAEDLKQVIAADQQMDES